MIRRPRCYKDKCDLVAAGLVTVCANGHINDFDTGTKNEIMREIDRMTKRSLRVIALAYNKIDKEEKYDRKIRTNIK